MTLHLVLSERTRGPIVDEAALAAALRNRAIAGAGIDVYGVEPIEPDHPLLSAPNTVLTPHLGYVTHESYRAYFVGAVEDIAAWRRGAPVRVL